ncbi:DUF1289 domain-containing protein [Methylobacterium sp. HMF5984]|jgi:predicted Fe-S protein YdhL (DUF1289 family)|uniref:DUF1289 domain-containing protein n=1 Tax=unclassified Methylobacterium TaxID=2615210 RepID=UPI0011CB00E3|nr:MULTISPECIES: DUF1289 domain-containing protein [unclassified Methylobacterium]MCJ2007939.1 DUF1289 domain-containing protein [Methylobacterium sp. J-092]MCJ2039500.1 DUF1289 domain-containing protein [Methylobacterium sp. J-059]MCJ2076937.1 DUF1289 domain-containing protein [Methylobacterium sp. E-016]MCJ2112223.1 DUF1289 domain-containing protein [Methylobacterium sp. E-025]TXN71933.1 DUF1289 domain-containing protein [Methylobacterium sp. WL6]
MNPPIPTSSGKPSSPCTKVCVLDGPSGLCIGCGRTRDEIGLWGSLSEPQRRAIMAGLPARLRGAGLAVAGTPA